VRAKAAYVTRWFSLLSHHRTLQHLNFFNTISFPLLSVISDTAHIISVALKHSWSDVSVFFVTSTDPVTHLTFAQPRTTHIPTFFRGAFTPQSSRFSTPRLPIALLLDLDLRQLGVFNIETRRTQLQTTLESFALV
jgi:hypothetical protein